MNDLRKTFELLTLCSLLLPLAGSAHAQDYECEAPLGTNCHAQLYDALERANPKSLAAGSTASTLLVLPGDCDPQDLIVDVDLDVEILHPYVGDLELTLMGPTGTSATVLYRPGLGVLDDLCPTDDLNASFDDDDGVEDAEACAGTIPAISGTLLPFNPLSIFDGKPRNGTWTLTVRDNAMGEQGVLMGWTLHLPCVPDLPDVNLDATDGLLGEQGDDDSASVTVTRGGDTDEELEVTYSVTGTASLEDFEALASTITIPAGDASATIEIKAVADDLAEVDETIVLTLQPSERYELGPRDSATVTLVEDAAEVAGPGAAGSGGSSGGAGRGGSGALADGGELDGGSADGGGGGGGGDSGCGCGVIGAGPQDAPLALFSVLSVLATVWVRRRQRTRS